MSVCSFKWRFKFARDLKEESYVYGLSYELNIS